MKTQYVEKNKGQILVIVTLMLVGLFAMLALVLDGGYLYTQRRAAQLAADAGALAGARAYCLEENVFTAIFDYVTNRNDAFLEGWQVEPDNGDVTVDASITFDTFFLHILGRPQLTASASATAACSPPTRGERVMPIAWSCRPPDLIGDEPPGEEDQCVQHLLDEDPEDNDDQCELGDDPIYIIVESDPDSPEIVCADPEDDDPPPDEDEVTYVDCDIDDDGVNDIDVMKNSQKSWIILEEGAGGTSDMTRWIEEGMEDPLNIHTWVAGKEGVAADIFHSIHETHLGRDVVIPVFNDWCPENPDPEVDLDETCITKYHEQDTVVRGPSDNKGYFHIISFALFRVACVDSDKYPNMKDNGITECPVHAALELPPQLKSIEGCFVGEFSPQVGGWGGPVDAGAFVVSLKK